jgi:hypothetical protein
MSDLLAYFRQHKTQILPIALVAILAILSLAINGLVQKNQELRSKAVADNGQLTFTPTGATTVPVGGTVDLVVNMVNGGQAVVGADILVQFDKSKLTLQSITPGVSPIFKTFLPIDTNGNFDTAKVVSGANNAASGGIAEFGIVSFDWVGNALTSPTPANTTLSPVATLRFQVKPGSSGTTDVFFKNDGTSATTDSNIVVIPTAGSPEDILQAPGYANDRVTLTVGSGSAASPSPIPTPSGSAAPSPSASATTNPSPTLSPSPSSSPGVSPSIAACTVRGCQDFNQSGFIEITDIQTIASRYGATAGTTRYGVDYDLDCNGSINILDIQREASLFGQRCIRRL